MSPKWIKLVGIASASVLTVGVIAVAKGADETSDDPPIVDAQPQATGDATSTPSGGGDEAPSEVASDADATGGGSVTSTTGTASSSGSATSGSATSTGASTSGTTTATGGGGSSGTTTGSTPSTATTGSTASYPHFGLVTQGITDTQVLAGFSYNVAGCGDAGTYSAMAEKGVLGDPQRAIDAFTQFINATGGIGGREYVPVIVDDGSGGCPEKTQAAAVELVDEDKVFVVAGPGIWDVSDYTISRKIPTMGGRDDPKSLKEAGPNGIGLVAALEPTFDAWASFGKYYIDSPSTVACLIHPDAREWNSYEEEILVPAVRRYGFDFKTVVRYSGEAQTAQQQADAAASRMKSEGCEHVYYMDVNPIAAVFLTTAATQNAFFPDVWTFTSYTGGIDFELAGRLMDQAQWNNAIGLSARVPAGEHPAEGQCKRIYERYYPNDGNSESASVLIACTRILPSAEYMRRGLALYGELNADTLLLGANAIDNDFYMDAHVPLDIVIEDPAGPFRTKPQQHFTVVHWNSAKSAYDFPDYPSYWKAFGPNLSGAEDLRSYWKDWEPIA